VSASRDEARRKCARHFAKRAYGASGDELPRAFRARGPWRRGPRMTKSRWEEHSADAGAPSVERIRGKSCETRAARAPLEESVALTSTGLRRLGCDCVVLPLVAQIDGNIARTFLGSRKLPPLPAGGMPLELDPFELCETGHVMRVARGAGAW